MTQEEIEAVALVLRFGKSFRRADTEYNRAMNTCEQPRLNKAGTRYFIAKIKLFAAITALSSLRNGERRG